MFFGFADQAILTWQLWAMHFPLRAEFVRCTRGDFRLPVILIDEGQILASLPVDSHIHVNDSPEELIYAVERLMNGNGRAAIAV
jgi:hypothetical protein